MALGGLGAGGGVNTCSRCARFGCMAARCGSGSVRALPLGKYSGHDSQLTGRYSTFMPIAGLCAMSRVSAGSRSTMSF